MTSLLIIGESGTGKSTSIRTLDHQETFIINVMNKPLPFKGWNKLYISVDELTGNLFVTDNTKKIIAAIKYVNEKRPEIKTLIIDDFQYTMANEFMRRALEKDWAKFSEIGQNAWLIINALNAVRSDLITIVLSHSETDATGHTKMKTIGKMLDEKVCVEGMFTIVLQSVIMDNQYMFITQHTGDTIAKSPLGMFDEQTIPNDLKMITDTIKNYNE